MNRRLALAAPIALLAPAAAAQEDCFVLDINGCGCLNFIQFNSMIALVNNGDPANSPSGNGDYDNDGDVDSADLAFWFANFIPCTPDPFAGTRTGFPEPGSVPVVVRRIGATDQYEVLAALDGPLDEVIGVTRATMTGPGGAAADFLDDGQSAIGTPWAPLGASSYGSLGIDADTYLAIGDRTDEPSPFIPLILDIDEQAFRDLASIDAPLGWHGDWFNTAQPTTPGAGGAAGNTNNEVLLLGVALADGQGVELDLEFAVATADGRLLITSYTGSVGTSCPADVNGDGLATPADFSAWILAFNTGSTVCDQNADGLCTPQDLTSWILNYNTGCP